MTYRCYSAFCGIVELEQIIDRNSVMVFYLNAY